MQQGVHLVLVTVPAGEGAEASATGERMARSLVEEKLAACVTRLPGAVSTYRWQDNVEVDREEQLLIKAPSVQLDSLIERIQVLHPNEVPEILAFPVDKGLPEYLAWVHEIT